MKESDLKKEIMDYLKALPGAYFRVIQVKGIKGRKSQSKGVPDILGAYLGRAVAIEVKMPGGRLSVEQDEFIRDWVNKGRGVAVVAMNLETVKEALRLISSGQT